MPKDIASKRKPERTFKEAARLHQSRYREKVLNVDYSEHGSMLTDNDGRALMNYHDGLGVRETLRRRFPRYSKTRDANMLRSEHIPFNLLAPLAGRPDLTKMIVSEAFGLELERLIEVKIEWAPQPKRYYLNDKTSFDTYLQGVDPNGKLVGIGIEVKYTECGSKMKEIEAKRIQDPDSKYWAITRESGLFLKDKSSDLTRDDLRQIWRNHLLGLAMVARNDIANFISITLYPSGNNYVTQALEKYQAHLKESARSSVCGCTFEHFIDCLQGDNEIERWKQFLFERYLVK